MRSLLRRMENALKMYSLYKPSFLGEIMREEIEEKILQALGLKQKASDSEVFYIECPYCDGDAGYVGCDEENQAIHYCPECDIYFKVKWDGAIVVAESENGRVIIEEI